MLALRSYGRMTLRRAAVAAAPSLVLAFARRGVDAATGGSSHVTHSIGGGSSGDLAHRWRLSYDNATRNVGLFIMFVSGVFLLVAVALARPRPPVVDAMLAALVVSFVVNDTPAGRRPAGERSARSPSSVAARSRVGIDSRRPCAASFLSPRSRWGSPAAAAARSRQPFPETVIGTVQQGVSGSAAGKALFASNGCGACHTLRAGGQHRQGRARPGQARRRCAEGAPGRARRLREGVDRGSGRVRRARILQGRDAPVPGQAHRLADRRSRQVPDEPLRLPDGFPREVAALACDLDRTLIAEDYVLRPRTRAALAAARAEGIDVVVVTGRMFQVGAAVPHRPRAGRLLPGRGVVDPASGEFLRHVGSRSSSRARRSARSSDRATGSTATSTTSSTSRA